MLTEDMDAFFSTDDFAVPGVLDGSLTVNGIHDPRYADPFMVEGVENVFICPIASAPSVAHGSTLVISGTTFKVRGVRKHEPGPDLQIIKLETQ